MTLRNFPRLHARHPALTLSLLTAVLVGCGGTETPDPSGSATLSGTVNLPAAVSLSLAAPSGMPDWSRPHVPGRVLVTGTAPQTGALSTLSLNGQQVAVQPVKGTPWQAAVTPAAQSDEGYAAQLASAGYTVQPDYLYSALTLPNDPGFPGGKGVTVNGSAQTQAYLTRINAASGWQTLQDAAQSLGGAKVAVLDTGADLAHPDLAGRLLDGYDFGDQDSDPSEDATSDAGHGTGTTGLIAALSNNGVGISGLTWTGQTVLPVKVFSGTAASTSALTAGLNYAVQRGARVVNMSLGLIGSNPDPALGSAIQAAAQADVLMVAAAGNTAGDGLYYPAADPNVVAVGALGDSDDLACYSARPKGSDKALDLVAPGGNAGTGTSTCYSFSGTQILTLTTTRNGSYTLEAGTSEAAPLVTGAAALVRAARPDLSAAQVLGVLRNSARTVAGGKLLDVGAAVNLAKVAAAGAARPYTLTVTALQNGQPVKTFSSAGTLTATQSAVPYSLSGVPVGSVTLQSTLTVNGLAYSGSVNISAVQDQGGVTIGTH